MLSRTRWSRSWSETASTTTPWSRKLPLSPTSKTRSCVLGRGQLPRAPSSPHTCTGRDIAEPCQVGRIWRQALHQTLNPPLAKSRRQAQPRPQTQACLHAQRRWPSTFTPPQKTASWFHGGGKRRQSLMKAWRANRLPRLPWREIQHCAQTAQRRVTGPSRGDWALAWCGRYSPSSSSPESWSSACCACVRRSVGARRKSFTSTSGGTAVNSTRDRSGSSLCASRRTYPCRANRAPSTPETIASSCRTISTKMIYKISRMWSLSFFFFSQMMHHCCQYIMSQLSIWWEWSHSELVFFFILVFFSQAHAWNCDFILNFYRSQNACLFEI